ncbi:hypothetical protein CTAYLR_003604 [Chrysophaeum taylorii]|uniref:IQCH-like ATP-grasp domain-containing protein n=1 Tax=Chrysophaeum taylorii TaxID=2483200 RepID=A0AAD7UEA9_9STRA|nr:hypothetical protein CTAYLR_003604 [Chrysophaeum taylorii]
MVAGAPRRSVSYSPIRGELATMRFDLPPDAAASTNNNRPSSSRAFKGARVTSKSTTKHKAAIANPQDWAGDLKPNPANTSRRAAGKSTGDDTTKNDEKPKRARATSFASADDALAESVKRIRNYTKLLGQQSLHHFIIWKGKRLSSTPEFAAFRRRYAIHWSNVNQIIGLLEDLCLKNGIPLALVDGSIVNALSKCDLHCLKLADLQSCVHNIDNLDSLELPATSVARSREPEEPTRSAVVIQAAVRRALARITVRGIAQGLGAAIRLQSSWRRFAAERAVLKGLAALRAARDIAWQELRARLRAHATSFAPGKSRVEIHVPSVGFTERARLRTPHFAATQAIQVARLCLAVDPAVHVVYVSPFALPDELVEYYRRILELGAKSGAEPGTYGTRRDQVAHAVVSSDATSARAAGGSFTIVVPEFVACCPEHTTLASLALYSPACCRRLRKLAERGFAVIVPAGPVGWAERSLALALDVPLLAPDPMKAGIFASRSGSKRVLHDADVNIPIGAHDIYDYEDFLVALAKLIASHLEIKRWLFWVDVDASAPSGVAYLDVETLDVVGELRDEFHKLVVLDRHKGETTWCHPEVQVLARTKVLRALRASLAKHVACATEWSTFIADVRHYGGVIEAEPRDVIGRQAIHVFIRPDGAISVIAPQEILINHTYDRVAAVFPLFSVPSDALAAAATAVARKLYAQEVVGHFTLHFVAYRSREEIGALRLWATELELGMNPFLVGHLLHRTVSEPRLNDGDDDVVSDCAYFLAPQIYHEGLVSMKFASFFKICRLHGMSFNVRHRTGPMFLLVDSLASGLIGALVQGPHRLDVLMSAFKLIAFLKKHVTTAHILYRDGVPDVLNLAELVVTVTTALRTEAASSDHSTALVNMTLEREVTPASTVRSSTRINADAFASGESNIAQKQYGKNIVVAAVLSGLLLNAADTFAPTQQARSPIVSMRGDRFQRREELVLKELNTRESVSPSKKIAAFVPDVFELPTFAAPKSSLDAPQLTKGIVIGASPFVAFFALAFSKVLSIFSRLRTKESVFKQL